MKIFQDLQQRRGLLYSTCLVLMMLGVGLFIFFRFTGCADNTQEISAQKSDETASTALVTCRVSAPNSTEGVIVTLRPANTDKNIDADIKLPVSHLIAPDKFTSDAIKIAKGDYNICVIGNINEDLSMYKTFSIDKTITSDTEIDIALELVEKDNVTDEMRTDYLNQLSEAMRYGDETLRGASAKELTQRLTTRVTEGAENKEVVASIAENTTNTSVSYADTAPVHTTQPTEKPSSDNTPAPAQPKRTWVAEQGHYEKKVVDRKWVANVVTIVDKEAWDERVTKTVYRFKDGWQTNDNTAFWNEYHKRQDAGENTQHVVYDETKTIHHDAVTHTEDHGHYEDVTKDVWVVDSPGHWE